MIYIIRNGYVIGRILTFKENYVFRALIKKVPQGTAHTKDWIESIPLVLRRGSDLTWCRPQDVEEIAPRQFILTGPERPIPYDRPAWGETKLWQCRLRDGSLAHSNEGGRAWRRFLFNRKGFCVGWIVYDEREQRGRMTYRSGYKRKALACHRMWIPGRWERALPEDAVRGGRILYWAYAHEVNRDYHLNVKLKKGLRRAVYRP